MQIERDADFVNQAAGPDGRIVFYFFQTGQWPNGMAFKGQGRYRLPFGAKDASWDADKHTIRYTLPREEGTGPANLGVAFKAKERLMTAIYKVYGLGTDFSSQWVAKTVLKNEGASVIQDVRVRYRLEGYSEWSMWQKFPELVPGQTAVSLYYPVLDKSIATLTSNTPANVHVEWRHKKPDGQLEEDSDGARIVLLGQHEYVFSDILAGESFGTWEDTTNNAPFIAAWCSRDDAVIKQFGAMANKLAGGVGASTDDESAVKVMKAIYDLMRINDFTYQHPPGLLDKSVSYDVQSVQNVKFPRDVLRDRSGTCIDLAIFYAAVANAVGLQPYLALIPGHCFPVLRVPSGTLVAVEATGVQGGIRAGSASFEDVFKYGIKELRESMDDGRIHLVDVQDLWTRGISPPELEVLPPDILQRWGVSLGDEGGGGGGGGRDAGGGGNAGGGGGGGGTTPPPTAGYAGTWGGQVSEQLPTGETIRYPVMLVIQQMQDGSFQARAQARATVPTEQGPLDMHLEQVYNGRVQSNGMLLLQGTRKVATNVSTGQQMDMQVDQVLCRVQGNQIQVRSGNDAEGYMDFVLSRQ
jgi:hypothetical protein